MRKILILVFIILFSISFSSYAKEEPERIDFDSIVRINSMEALPINGLKLDYNLFSFDYRIDLKYLLSGNIKFKLKWENFTWNKYNKSIFLGADYKYYVNDSIDKNNNTRTLYFHLKDKKYILFNSISKYFRFKFCPYSDIDWFWKCWYSPRAILNRENISNDTYSNMQYYLKDMSILSAKRKIKDDKNIATIAVIDDGIKLDNPDLEWKYWFNKSEIAWNWIDDDQNWYVDDVKWWNFINSTGSMSPKWEHWTVVSSIIWANTNNWIWIAWIMDNVKIMPIITCARESCKIDDINKSIIYAVDNWANIIYLNTWNIWFEYDKRFSSAIEYANKAWVIIVTATWDWDEFLKWPWINTSIHKISPVCNEEKKHEIIWVSSMSVFSDKTKDGLISSWSNHWDCSDISAYWESIVSLWLYKVDSKNSKKKELLYNINDWTSISSAIVTWIIWLWFNKYWKVDAEIVLKALNLSKDKWHWINAEKYVQQLWYLVKEYKLDKKVIKKWDNEIKKKLSKQTEIVKKEISLREKYKKAIRLKLWNRLDNINPRLLKLLLTKIDSFLDKNKSLSENKIEKIKALRDVVGEYLLN